MTTPRAGVATQRIRDRLADLPRHLTVLDSMHETQIIRNAIQHAYHDVVADELREAAQIVKLNARDFIRTLLVFLENEGIVRST